MDSGWILIRFWMDFDSILGGVWVGSGCGGSSPRPRSQQHFNNAGRVMNELLKGREATLDRWPGERTVVHRALLLWAMQTPKSRSNRAVSRAIGSAHKGKGRRGQRKKGSGASESAVRGWAKQNAWKARLAPYGEDADQYALDLYRSLYMADYGPIELPIVADRITRPLGSLELNSPAAQASHEARIRVSQALPMAKQEVEQATARAVVDHRRSIRSDAERHIKLVDASLGLIAKKLKNAEVKVSVRDIPVLLECRDRLVSVVSGSHRSEHGPVVETARVQIARQTGQDVVGAMLIDAQELVAILGAIRSAGQADLSTIAEQDQRARETAASKQA